MNIDMAQERDGGRASSLAQQQPDKLKEGEGVRLHVGRTLGFKILAECVDECTLTYILQYSECSITKCPNSYNNSHTRNNQVQKHKYIEVFLKALMEGFREIELYTFI